MGKKHKPKMNTSKKNKSPKKKSSAVAPIPSTIYEYLGAIHPAITEFGNSQETIDNLIELWELYRKNESEITIDHVCMDNPCDRTFLNCVCTSKEFNAQIILDLEYEIDIQEGVPFLDLAALCGILELLEYFVEVLEFALGDAYSIIPNAMESGNMEVVDYLISKGIVPGSIDNGIINFNKDIYCMEHLLAQGFEIRGDSFNIAAQDCDIVLLHFLIDHLGPENLNSINIAFVDLVCNLFSSGCSLEDMIHFFGSFINRMPFQYLMEHRGEMFISICNRCSSEELINGHIIAEELSNEFINLLKTAGAYDNEFALNMIYQLDSTKHLFSPPRFNFNDLILKSITPLAKKIISTYCSICNLSTNYHCDICKTVYYCSRDCQRVDWMGHKQICELPNEHIICSNYQCTAVANSVCGKCKVAHYCSKKCQESHWPIHKKICNK